VVDLAGRAKTKEGDTSSVEKKTDSPRSHGRRFTLDATGKGKKTENFLTNRGEGQRQDDKRFCRENAETREGTDLGSGTRMLALTKGGVYRTKGKKKKKKLFCQRNCGAEGLGEQIWRPAAHFSFGKQKRETIE